MSTSGPNSCCDACQGSLCPGDMFCGACGKHCDADIARGFIIRRPATRGDTIQIDFDLLDKNGGPLDLSPPSVKVWFTIKRFLNDVDSGAVAQATLANGGVSFRDLTTSGRVTVTIAATATVGFPEGTEKFYYDLQVLDGTGRITTVEKGLFLMDPDVTRSIS